MSSVRENSILIDWLSFTTTAFSPQEIIELLGLQDKIWETKNGAHGYKERLWYDSISVHFNGREDMGVWCEMSGQGCRAYESEGANDYKSLFSLILNNDKVHVTRLDVAFDEYDGILDISRVCSDTLKQNYRSKMDYYSVQQSSSGQSLNIGSYQSDVMIRIYDKLAERLSKLKSNIDKERIRDEIPHWIRVELQLRDDRAKEFIRHLSEHNREIGATFTGVLRNYLEYGYWRNDNDDGERRFCCYNYWEKLLNGAQALSIYVTPGVDYNLARCQRFVTEQSGNAIDTLFKIYGIEHTIKLIQERTVKQNPKYINLINKHKDEFEKTRENNEEGENKKMKATIIGIEKIEKMNKDTGEVTTSHNLHIVRDEKKGEKNISGRKVENIWVSFDLPEGVRVGSRCNFDFEQIQTRNGSFSRLEDIELIEQMKISIAPVPPAVPNAGK